MDYFNFSDRPNISRINAIAKTFELSIDPYSVHLYLEFQQTYREIEKSYNYLLEKFNLSESRFSILMFLSYAVNEQLSPSEIANKLNVTRPTASKLIKGLQSQGLVATEQASNDKRSTVITITSQGKKLLHEFLPYNYQAVNNIFEDFTEEEQLQFSFLLKKILMKKNNIQSLGDTINGNE